MVTVIVVLVLASAFGVWRRLADGRVRRIADAVDTTPFAAFGPLGSRATIVQFSSTFCAPCRAAKAVARDIVSTMTGVTHLEIDAERHLELATAHGVQRTPTVLVLDGRGRLSARIVGVPKRDALLEALDDRRFENL